MPLRRASTGMPQPNVNGIIFPMEDVAGGGLVVCEVWYDYLQQRTGATESALTHFEALRDEIEGKASEKYDRGVPPIVRADDI
jgi:hypothetical protein